MKKRFLLGIPAFFIAFIIGYLVVPGITADEPAKPPIVEKIPVSQPHQTDQLETVDTNEFWKAIDLLPRKMELLETGDAYDADEITARNGETWLGLFEDNGRYTLQSTKISVKTRKIGPKERSKDIRLIDGRIPIFLAKKTTKLRPGVVVGLFHGMHYGGIQDIYERAVEEVAAGLGKGFIQKYQLGGKSYELNVIEARDIYGNHVLALFLSSEGKKQLLAALHASNISVGSLYWVGDIDGDGKLDLYMSLDANVCIYQSLLYLSSEARHDQLVGMAGSFYSAGD